MVQLCVEKLTEYRRYICDTNSLYFSCILKGDVAGFYGETG
ncbi:MAG: hypothetical protein PUD93_08850 [Lachnospiraceae bacterium]|nr:hypothetical protein [Lachnospiraceae bacterium]